MERDNGETRVQKKICGFLITFEGEMEREKKKKRKKISILEIF